MQEIISVFDRHDVTGHDGAPTAGNRQGGGILK